MSADPNCDRCGGSGYDGEQDGETVVTFNCPKCNSYPVPVFTAQQMAEAIKQAKKEERAFLIQKAQERADSVGYGDVFVDGGQCVVDTLRELP